MPVEAPGDLVAREPLAPVGDPLDAQHEARRAKAALEAGGGLERVGVEAALVVRHAFDGDDRAAFDLLGAKRAGRLRFAVDENQAGAAFVLRRAAGFHRLDLECLPQDLDE